MPSQELSAAKNQLKGWNTQVQIHEDSIGYVNKVLAVTDIATDVAIFAGISALTFGLASYLATTGLAARVGAVAAARAQPTIVTIGLRVAAGTESTTIGYMNWEIALRVIAGIGAGTTARLTAAELTAAYIGIASRVTASVAVGGAAMCIGQKMRGGKIDTIFLKNELLAGIFWCIVLAWLGAPGPRSEFKDSLTNVVTKKLPSWRHQTLPMPSAQTLTAGGTQSYRLYKLLDSGGYSIDKIMAAMKKDGISYEEELAGLSKTLSTKMYSWSLETCIQLLAKTRQKAQALNYSGQVGEVAATGHFIREFISNDIPIDRLLKAQYTELFVAQTGRDFWEGMVTYFECLDDATASPKCRRIESQR